MYIIYQPFTFHFPVESMLQDVKKKRGISKYSVKPNIRPADQSDRRKRKHKKTLYKGI